MRSVVFIFVPWQMPREPEPVWIKHVDVEKPIKDTTAARARAKPIEDAEQMPLWKWFAF